MSEEGRGLSVVEKSVASRQCRNLSRAKHFLSEVEGFAKRETEQ